MLKTTLAFISTQCFLALLCGVQPTFQSAGLQLPFARHTLALPKELWLSSERDVHDALRHRRRLSQTRKQAEAAQYCTTGNFTALYDTIHRDLRFWNTTGIPAKLMDWMLGTMYKFPIRHKGAGILFKGGKPFIITDPGILNTTAHHQRLIAAHFALFLALSSTFGPAIPDVEFLFSTADEPSTLLAYHANGTAPERLPAVLSFCKSPRSHADVLVPDIHFFMRNFTGRLLAAAANFTATWPWERKTPRLFGRFSPYARAANKQAPELYRKGKGGKEICKKGVSDVFFCDVRKHYMWEWARRANRSGLPVDVAQQPKHDMMHHASFKWLLHLDGQTCSSRLEQLLVLGSLVVKEESGYEAFFHHLIHPYQHYVPVWKEVPEETKVVLQWAQQHDSEAAAIAAAAQRVATTFLHKRALMCYWLRLMQEMAPLLRYTPGPEGGARSYPHMMPVEEYMRAVGWRELERNHLGHMEFWD